jgi:hypothetical protein
LLAELTYLDPRFERDGPRPVGERSRLVAAVEVQLECVDPLEAKLR